MRIIPDGVKVTSCPDCIQQAYYIEDTIEITDGEWVEIYCGFVPWWIEQDLTKALHNSMAEGFPRYLRELIELKWIDF